MEHAPLSTVQPARKYPLQEMVGRCRGKSDRRLARAPSQLYILSIRTVAGSPRATADLDRNPPRIALPTASARTRIQRPTRRSSSREVTQEGFGMSGDKSAGDLTPEERKQLQRDCRESGVTVAIQDQQAIVLIAKSGSEPMLR